MTPESVAEPLRPAIVLARVDFPAPFSPTMPNSSPRPTVNVTPRTAVNRLRPCRAGYSIDRSLATTTEPVPLTGASPLERASVPILRERHADLPWGPGGYAPRSIRR